jgi:hypothetical protein
MKVMHCPLAFMSLCMWGPFKMQMLHPMKGEYSNQTTKKLGCLSRGSISDDILYVKSLRLRIQ